MVWFKVDDAFDDHPKALAAGNAAVGLWTRCGAYSSRYLLEGFVPAEVARAKGTKTEIARLVGAGLWTATEGGYQMHDFLDWNPSADTIKEKRAKTAERVKEWRAQKQRDKPSSNGVTPHVTNGVTNAPCNASPDPTRPDPLTSRSLTTSTVVAIGRSVEEDQSSDRAEDPDPPHRTGAGIYRNVARQRA